MPRSALSTAIGNAVVITVNTGDRAFWEHVERAERFRQGSGEDRLA